MTESAAIEHFTDLYLRHYRQAYGYAVGRAGRDLAEEVASEVFLITRERGVDTDQQRILISVLAGSDQESDLTEPVVCDGLGRIRHFAAETSSGWPDNPLPIAPAARWLRKEVTPQVMRALVYQNAVCNWRCWYCFVPYNLLAGHASRSRWVTADQLVELYKQLPEQNRPELIDLSGGQPDLIPEWTVWMLDALSRAGLTRQVYLWSDDNLSNDYLFRFLSDDQVCRLAASPNYGRACCLKGFDRASFAFNTDAPPEHFDRQIMLLRRLVEAGIDVYCYATFTTPTLPHPTRIVSLSEGFDFLGFNLRRYPNGKLLIKPGAMAIKRLRERLAKEFRALRGSNVAAVLAKIVPIVRGWVACYRTVVSSRVFAALTDYLWKLTYKWACWTHPNKPERWIADRYFRKFDKFRNDRWVFGNKDTGAYLPKPSWTDIVRHTLVKGRASPDDPALADYWAQRRRKVKPPLDSYTVHLLTRQDGRCSLCGENLLTPDQPPQSPQGWEHYVGHQTGDQGGLSGPP